MIRCHERDHAHFPEAGRGSSRAAFFDFLSPSGGIRPPAPGEAKNRSLRVQGIRLDQYTLKFQLAQQLPAHCALLVFTCCVAGLADRHTQLNAESPGR